MFRPLCRENGNANTAITTTTIPSTPTVSHVNILETKWQSLSRSVPYLLFFVPYCWKLSIGLPLSFDA